MKHVLNAGGCALLTASLLGAFGLLENLPVLVGGLICYGVGIPVAYLMHRHERRSV